MGVFEWFRVPMGVKPAANYFHNTMTSIVLLGLVFVICEVYLDDILVYGKTLRNTYIISDQFLNDLENIKLH
jgi:hypothetical protein